MASPLPFDKRMRGIFDSHIMRLNDLTGTFPRIDRALS
jgi:hypothetical protein